MKPWMRLKQFFRHSAASRLAVQTAWVFYECCMTVYPFLLATKSVWDFLAHRRNQLIFDFVICAVMIFATFFLHYCRRKIIEHQRHELSTIKARIMQLEAENLFCRGLAQSAFEVKTSIEHGIVPDLKVLNMYLNTWLKKPDVSTLN